MQTNKNYKNNTTCSRGRMGKVKHPSNIVKREIKEELNIIAIAKDCYTGKAKLMLKYLQRYFERY